MQICTQNSSKSIDANKLMSRRMMNVIRIPDSQYAHNAHLNNVYLCTIVRDEIRIAEILGIRWQSSHVVNIFVI